MIRVLALLPGNMAVVSTKGLQRVRLKPGGEILDELLAPAAATALVSTFNGCSLANVTAESVDYGSLAQSIADKDPK